MKPIQNTRKSTPRVEDIRQLIEREAYDEAFVLAKGIPYSSLKDFKDIMFIEKVLKEGGDPRAARDLLMRQHSKSTPKGVLIELIECSLMLSEIKEATRFFGELKKNGTDELTKLEMSYKIKKAQGESLTELISVLESMKQRDYREKYAYELAKLYKFNDDLEKCYIECRNICQWFVEGEYVSKAEALMAYLVGQSEIDPEPENGEEAEINEVDEHEFETEIAETPEAETTEAASEETELLEAEQEEDESEETEILEEPENVTVTEESLDDSEETVREDVFEAEDTALVDAEIETEEESVENTEENTEENGEVNDRIVNEYISEYEELTQEEMQVNREPVIKPESDYSVEEFLTGKYEQLSMWDNPDIWFNMREDCELYDPGFAAVDFIVPKKGGKFARALEKNNVDFEKIMGTFVRMESVRKQLIRGLDIFFDNKAECVYLVLTGDPVSGKTTFAYRFMNLLKELEVIKDNHYIRVQGKNVSKNLINKNKEKMAGRAVLIEHAGGLSKDALDAMVKCSKSGEGPRAVILEDSLPEVNKVLRYADSINATFSYRIHLPAYDEEALFGFALEEIHELGYSVDKMAAELLKEKMKKFVIETTDKKLKMLNLYIKDTIREVDERNKPAILDMARNARFAKGNFMVITKEDLK